MEFQLGHTHSNVTSIDMNESEDDLPPVKSVVTAVEFLHLGLDVWFTKERLQAMMRTKNSKITTFKMYYGVRPSLCATLWEDLQQTTVQNARIDDPHLNPKHFLMALHTLKKYPTDKERVGKSLEI